jgi:ketosteroid isomerase-like protein
MTLSPTALVERLLRAVNAHDLDEVVDCFAETYRNETPVHPSRGFVGRAQVRDNWARIFDGVPDVRADVTRMSSDGLVVWSEWEMRGTRRDGVEHLMRGVIVFGVEDAHLGWARFYLEPVDESGDTVGDAVARAVGAPR